MTMAVAVSLAQGQSGGIHRHGRSLGAVAKIAAFACPDRVALAARLAHDYMCMEISVLVGRSACCMQARRQ